MFRFLALLLFGFLVACQTKNPDPNQPQNPSTAQAGMWSNPATWSDGKVPDANSEVLIPSGQVVTLDTNAQVKTIWIEGTLTFGKRDLELKTNWMMVHGAGLLQIGNEVSPFEHQATITLTGAASDLNKMGCGDKFICAMMGGTLKLYSQSASKKSWSKLAQHLNVGDTSLQLLEPSGWQPNDEIVIAPTGYDHTQAELVTVTSVSSDGKTVGFTPPALYPHWGQVQTIEGHSLDSRAEVGLLSKNIVIRSDPSSVEPFYNGKNALTNADELAADPSKRFGGHVMVMDGKAYLNGVQFVDMGQATRLGRYAFHWHFSGDATGQFVKNSSVKNSYTRGLVIHATDNATLEGNVVYNTVSHNYIFAEDGSEDGNSILGNLGIRTTLLPQKHRIFQDDPNAPLNSNSARRQDEHRPSGFWGLSNNNRFVGNVAAGSEGNGFHLAQRGKLTRLEGFEFRDNVAHSNFQTNGGNDLYPPNTRGHGIFINSVSGLALGISKFTAYKNAASGAWLEGSATVLRQSLLADNNAGAISFQNRVEDTVMIGQTANTNGIAKTLGEGKAGGIHLMRNQGGLKRPQISNVQFIDFQDAAVVINELSADLQTHSEKIKLVRSQPVLLHGVGESLMGGFQDRDGSLTGSASPKLVLGDLALQVNSSCTRQASWKAYVCPFDLGLVGFEVASWTPKARLEERKEFWELPAKRSDGATGKILVRGAPTASGLLVSGLHYDFDLPEYTDPKRTTPMTAKATKIGIDPDNNGLSPNPSAWLTVSVPYEGSSVFVYRELNGVYDPSDPNYRGPNITSGLSLAVSVAAVETSNGDNYFVDSTQKRVYLKLRGSDAPIYMCETSNCQ
jgi:G8 domain